MSSMIRENTWGQQAKFMHIQTMFLKKKKDVKT